MCIFFFFFLLCLFLCLFDCLFGVSACVHSQDAALKSKETSVPETLICTECEKSLLCMCRLQLAFLAYFYFSFARFPFTHLQVSQGRY